MVTLNLSNKISSARPVRLKFAMRQTCKLAGAGPAGELCRRALTWLTAGLLFCLRKTGKLIETLGTGRAGKLAHGDWKGVTVRAAVIAENKRTRGMAIIPTAIPSSACRFSRSPAGPNKLAGFASAKPEADGRPVKSVRQCSPVRPDTTTSFARFAQAKGAADGQAIPSSRSAFPPAPTI